MSNSFNISSAVELAAIEAKVDIIDTEVDTIRATDLPAIKNDTGPIRNDVTAIHDTNLPAVKVDTGSIRNDVTAIHDTNLPAVKTDTGAIRNDMTDVHDVNLPAVKTDTGAVRNDMNDVKDTDLPAAKAVLDANALLLAIMQLDLFLVVSVSDHILLTSSYDGYHTLDVYTKEVEMRVGISGTYRVSFSIRNGNSDQDTYGRVYKNSVAFGTEQSVHGLGWVVKTEDLVFSGGDLVQIYTKTSLAGTQARLKEFRIKGDVAFNTT